MSFGELITQGRKLLLPHRRAFYSDAFLRRVSERRMRVFLCNLGIREGMLIYIQASFGSFGYYPKGCVGFLKLLREMVGPTGTIVMPSFPFGGSMAEFVRTDPVFDVARTRSAVGALPEALRLFPGACRSIHPTHPVVAIGMRAEALVAGHELCETPQGRSSPFQRLVEWNAHILRIGTPAFPVCHHLQEMVDFPNLFEPDPVTLRCVDWEGRVIPVKTKSYRRRVPFVLFLDGDNPNDPVPMNIIDFPLLFAGRENRLVQESEKRVPIEWLVGLRRQILSPSDLHVETLNNCVCELFPVQPVFDFAVTTLRVLLDRYRTWYADPDALLRGLEEGRIII